MNAKSRIYNIPNLITSFRFFLAGVLMILPMLEQNVGIALTSWAVFFLAATSDWVDGYFARRYQSVTVLGKLMDPLADKVLVATALIMLIPSGKLPAWMVLLILAREIVITGLRSVASTSGIVVAASTLGKFKSITQYIGLGFLIFPLGVLPFPVHKIGLIIMYFALFITLWSGGDYFYKLRRIFLEDN